MVGSEAKKYDAKQSGGKKKEVKKETGLGLTNKKADRLTTLESEIKKMKIKNCYFPLFVCPGVLQMEKDHVEGFAPEIRYLQALIVFVSSNMVLAITPAAVCDFIAPAAACSGIPEAKACLNGVDAPSILAPRTLLVKVY